MWYIHRNLIRAMEDAMPWNKDTQKDYKRDWKVMETTLTDRVIPRYEFATIRPCIDRRLDLLLAFSRQLVY